MQHFYRTKTSNAVRFADTIERTRLERLELYNVFFRPLRAKDLMGIRFDTGKGRELAVGSAREKVFNERERQRMEFLRPHISRAFCNSAMIAEAGRRPFGPAYMLSMQTGSMQVASVKVAEKEGVITLTSRELEILHWITEGKTNPEIGIILNISPRTVQKHVENLFRKLNVSSRTGAAMRAIELGYGSVTTGSGEYEQLIARRDAHLRHATAPIIVQ